MTKLFLSILLVDDDEDDKLLFFDALAEIDGRIQCEYFNHGEQALKWLSAIKDLPNYIFLDLNMPRMNGIEILKAVKSDLRTADIPVIIYSTSHNQQHREEAKRLGASWYIVKPYRLEDLKKEILFAIESIKPD